MLNRDSILQTATAHADDRQGVDVPAWGGSVYVAPLTLGDIRKASRDAEEKGVAEMSVYIARCVQHEDGGRVFVDADAATIDKMKLGDLKPVTEAINKVNGFDDDPEAEAGKSPTTTD